MEKRNTTPLLIAQNGSLSGKQWLIDHDLLIGRDACCDLFIDDRQVSRKHARVYLLDDGAYLEDLQSKNGTYINHKKIESSALLHEGDVIQVALIQDILFISSDATIPLSDDQVYRWIYIDRDNNTVWIKDKKIDPPLSVQQYSLLIMLYENEGSIVSRNEITARVWEESSGAGISNEAIDALVRRLRYRLAEYEPDIDFIETLRGYGFRFQNPIRK